MEISRFVDVIMPMTYFAAYGEDPVWAGARASYFRSVVFSPYVSPIIQAFRDVGKKDYDVTSQDVIDAVDSARTSKADGFILFTYIHIRDELEANALETICAKVSRFPAYASWTISIEFDTDLETYFVRPTINMEGSFLWKSCMNPLGNHPITVRIRTPPIVKLGRPLIGGRWLDFELHGYTTEDGTFIGQLSGLVMRPGEWMLRVEDDVYGAAATATFQVKPRLRDLILMVLSPVTLHFYDAEDRHVGINDTGGIDLEIPGAHYSDIEGEPEWILIPEVANENFKVALEGTGNGNYSLALIFAVNETLTAEESMDGQISINATRAYSVNASIAELSLYDWHAHGDVNGDGEVDIFDIVAMATNYGVIEHDPNYDPNCDIDGDGDIDIFDIVVAATHYGESW